MTKKKIVWVEDDEDIISILKPRFTQEGWELLTAPTAKEGMDLARKICPDLIIMDIIMPGEHGYAAIEDFKEEPTLAKIPIIVFSGVMHRWSETSATRHDGLLSKADVFVDKSEKPDVLFDTIRNYL